MELRLGRLFNRESGRSFITAIDHGVTIGVPTGAERVVETVERIVASGPDAVLMGPGLLAKAGHLFGFRGAPAPIVRADWIQNEPRLFALGHEEAYRVVCTPARAAALGADAFIMFLIMGPGSTTMFADNVAALARAADETHAVGLPLIVEAVLWGSRITEKKDPELLAYACRTAAELGADAIKTEWTGDTASMADVINGCPAPVLVLGGAKTDTPEPMLAATRGAMEAGAKGVVYGRNVWQADDPAAVARSLKEIIHGRALVGV